MIDAKTFASAYSGFWRTETPACELFVRRMNMGLLERFDVPMGATESTRSGFVSEFAFSCFSLASEIAAGKTKQPDPDTFEELSLTQTRSTMAPYEQHGVDLESPLSRQEKSEAGMLYRRLINFFRFDARHIIVRPRFAGCGFVDASEGDVIEGECLYEIKSVERNFRSVDIRQLITYAALNYTSHQFSITSVGLMNPRKGVYITISLDDLCTEIAGLPAPDTLALICFAISSGEISR